MAFFENCVERATALAATCGWLAFGGGAEAAVGVAIGGAGLAAVVSDAVRRHGPESEAALKSIRKRISADLAAHAEVERWDTRADLEAADASMERALAGCFLDRKALAASARSPQGFPGSATKLILARLAEREPATFGQDGPLAARDFADLVVRTALEAAIENDSYFKNLQPHLLMETLRGLGTVEESIAAGFKEQSRQRDEDRGDLQRILGIVEALQAANLRPNLTEEDAQKVEDAIRSPDPEMRRSAYLSRKIVNMARATHELVLDMRRLAAAENVTHQATKKFRDMKFEGDLLRAEGDLVAAVDAYERALAIEPSDGYACAALANTLIDLTLHGHPDGDHWIRDRDEFGDALDKAGKLVLPFMKDDCSAPADARVAAIRAFSHIWFEFARRGLAGSDAIQQSTDALKKADEIDPDNPTTLRLLGRNYHLFLGDRAVAEGFFKRAVSIDNAGVDSRFFYAMFLAGIGGREAEAEEAFESALHIEPDDPNVLEAFASLLSKRPESEEKAELLWKHSLRLHPKHPVAWLHYGRFLSKRAESAIGYKKENAEQLVAIAEDILKQGLSQRPNDAGLWCEYAVLLEHIKGRESDAISAYERALSWQPDSVEPYVRLRMLQVIGGFSKESATLGLTIMNEGVEKNEPRLIVAGAWIGLLFGREEDQADALKLLKSMVDHYGDDLQFLIQSRVIAHAVDVGNRRGQWLSKLADVIGGILPLSALDAWAEWSAIDPSAHT